MSADTTRVDSSEPSVAQAKVNTLSIVSIVLVAASAMGIAVRPWSWGPIFAGLHSAGNPRSRCRSCGIAADQGAA
jgi:hypothetical protein